LNHEQHHAHIFEAFLNRARRQLSLQQDVLRLLFDRAKDANDATPPFPDIRLDRLTDEEIAVLSQYRDKHDGDKGARDAYATAIVIFIDTMLKELATFYERIPSVERGLTVGVDGTDLGTIFRLTANNVRHYLDWRVHFSKLTHRDQAIEAAKMIATLTGKDEPTLETVAVYADNWAWPILAKISGRTFEGLVEIVGRFMDEMLSNACETGRPKA
jgi:hypothetical protein